MSIKKIRRHKPAINIVPLVDVLTVLLFFFLVTMQFKEFKTLNIVLPEFKTAGLNRVDEQMVISIDRDETIYFNQMPLSPEGLESIFQSAKTLNQNASLLIMADESVEIKVIAQIMDICRANNLNKIRLQSR
jgi:biopolymer transport protein ExbD